MHPIYFLLTHLHRRGKTILASMLVVVFTVLISADNTQALYSYIETKIVTENNAQFELNGSIGHFNTISTNDVMKSLDTPVQFILNNVNSIILQAHSQIQFLKLGENPLIILNDGSIEVQTSTEAQVYSDNNVIIVQGGAKITHTDEYSQIGNYYGSTQINIANEKDKKILSYNLPIQKQISIYKKIYKENWNKIRYTKLNKELHLQVFKEVAVRQSFIPYDFSTLTQHRNTESWKTLFTWNPYKKQMGRENVFLAHLQILEQAIINKSPSQIKNEVAVLSDYLNLPQIKLLPKLIYTVQDSITRYTLENELAHLFNKNNSSINTEIKYFYNIWQQKDEQSEKKLHEAVMEKIKKHSTNLYALEEDYNLITALIEAYPQMVTQNTLTEKKETEMSLYKIMASKTEKIDILLSSYTKDLDIIILLIENDNGQLAKAVYDSMLINTEKLDDPVITSYRDQLRDYENEIALLMDFYKEELHASGYNETVFNIYKQQKEQEIEAVNLFKSNIQTIRTRPIKHDFSTIVTILKSQKIAVKEEDISFVLLGGKLLYIQNAQLELEQDPISFHFVFDPELKIISQVTWSNENRPPMNDNIPLEHFQDAIIALQKIDLEKHQLGQVEKTSVIKDWIETSEDANNVNYEFAIKKRLAKDHLAEKGINSKENDMQMYQNTINIDNAIFLFTDETKKEIKISVNLRLQLDTWEVLGIQLADFPTRKIRIASLEQLKKDIPFAYQEETDKKLIREEAVKSLKVFTDRITEDQFTVTNKDKQIVSFPSMSFFFKTKDDGELIWSVSGEFNTQTKIFLHADCTKNGKTTSLVNIPLSSFQLTLLGDSTTGSSIPRTRNQVDAQQVIQDTLKESDMKEVKSILDEENSFF